MSVALERMNGLDEALAREEFLRCCGATRWAAKMAAARPYRAIEEVYVAADRFWGEMGESDWREAMSHHPRIGEQQLRDRWASGEQAGVQGASEQTIQGLARGNREYEQKFGHIFLVCATGKTADEMLAILRSRMSNDAKTELAVAAGEQARITRIRLEKLLK